MGPKSGGRACGVAHVQGGAAVLPMPGTPSPPELLLLHTSPTLAAVLKVAAAPPRDYFGVLAWVCCPSTDGAGVGKELGVGSSGTPSNLAPRAGIPLS